MIGPCLGKSGATKQLLFGNTGLRTVFHHTEHPLRQGAGLVECHTSQTAQKFQVVASFNQNSVSRRASDPAEKAQRD